MTSELRPHDAAVLISGLPVQFGLRIPPRQSRFAVQVDAKLKLAGGVQAFSTALHAHKTGVRLQAWLLRGGEEVAAQ